MLRVDRLAQARHGTVSSRHCLVTALSETGRIGIPGGEDREMPARPSNLQTLLMRVGIERIAALARAGRAKMPHESAAPTRNRSSIHRIIDTSGLRPKHNEASGELGETEVGVKGPYERLKYTARRVWECPTCKHRERTEGSVTNQYCRCQQELPLLEQVGMQLIKDGVRRTARSSEPVQASGKAGRGKKQKRQ